MVDDDEETLRPVDAFVNETPGMVTRIDEDEDDLMSDVDDEDD